MDSHITDSLHSLQRDLAELELRESSLKRELDEVHAKMRLIRNELNKLNQNENVTQDILERVYSQRKGFPAPGKK